MKALSLQQPWASLVVLGIKRLETRTWAPRWRGRLAIHASKTTQKAGRQFDQEIRDRLQRAGAAVDQSWRKDSVDHRLLRAFDAFPEEALPTGAVLGFVTLQDVQRIGRSDQQQVMVGDELCPNPLVELWVGDFAEGRFAWLLEEPSELDQPIPARGSLGLWEWEGP